MFKRYVFREGLTNLMGSDGEFCINIHGRVKDKFGDNIPTSLDDDGNVVVTVKSWDGLREYRVIDLVAIHFKDLCIPKENYSDVLAFTLDGDKNNVHAKNIGYRFKNKIEVKSHPGFYYIPGFTRYGIDIDGNLLNVERSKYKKWGTTKSFKPKNIKGGYYVASVSICGLSSAITRHRTLCLTFKDYPDNVDIMTVNHKNGIPGDDRLDNLEWTTKGENNIHAYVNDLKGQHKRVLVRDVLSGDVVEYYSIAECARVLGYATDETIRYRLYRCEFGSVFQDGKQFKFKSDSRDWVIPEDPLLTVKNAQLVIGVVSRNCKTLEVLNHGSVSDASRITGIKVCSILFRLNKEDKNPLFGYQFKRTDDTETFPDFTMSQYLESLSENSLGVECRNLLSGENRYYSSVNSCSLDLNHCTISGLLRKGQQPLYSDGWQVKYEGVDWVEIKDFEEELYKRREEVMARNEETGDLIIADSSRHMGRILSIDNKSIRKAALTRGQKVYRGYRFRLGVTDESWPVNS